MTVLKLQMILFFQSAVVGIAKSDDTGNNFFCVISALKRITKYSKVAYRENVLYPYVPMKESSKGLILENRCNYDRIHQFEEINSIST